MPLGRVHPQIRIAHENCGPLNIGERIIFDHEFVLITRGEGELVADGNSIDFRAGDLLFIPPFVPHSFTSKISVTHIAVHFDFAESVP